MAAAMAHLLALGPAPAVARPTAPHRLSLCGGCLREQRQRAPDKFGRPARLASRRSRRRIGTTAQQQSFSDLVHDNKVATSGGAQPWSQSAPIPDTGPRLAAAASPPALSLKSDFGDEEIWRLRGLVERLQAAPSVAMKAAVIEADNRVRAFFYGDPEGMSVLKDMESLPEDRVLVLKCLVAIGQEHVLRMPEDSSAWSTVGRRTALLRLADVLAKIEQFYDCLGGVVGYQLTCLELIKAHVEGAPAESSSEGGCAQAVEQAGPASGEHTGLQESTSCRYHLPAGIDLSADRHFSAQAAAWGLDALPHLAEVYPLGGAGDRLGLVDEVTGEPLPVALLNYCGRTLLEGLVRDVQAREYLYYRLRNRQVRVPIAVMTSDAKNNHAHVTALLEERAYFGRGADSFRVFSQPLVPTVAAEDGKWLVPAPLEPLLKPGGHGVIWKLAKDNGVFKWFAARGCTAAIVRQISNPMAATDTTLLALAGVGRRGNKTFGFASCDRKVGSAEGVNVLVERRTEGGQWAYGVTNIEYTEFERLGIVDEPVAPGVNRSKYPANTNVLYVNLPATEGALAPAAATAVEADGASGVPLQPGEKPGMRCFPGMILNLKKKIKFTDADGRRHEVLGGRLECTMQNIADFMVQRFSQQLPKERHAELNTFVVYNLQRKVTSSAKKQREPGSLRLHQSPDGSFLDLMRNAHELLARCGMSVPPVPAEAEYLSCGPSFIFLFHPALGPLWDVIEEKVRGGRLAPRSELQLEVAEALLDNVDVTGSLLVRADNVVGSIETPNPHAGVRGVVRMGGGLVGSAPAAGGTSGEPRLWYSDQCARIRLKDVVVVNKGVDWDNEKNVFWQHRVVRKESVAIVLRGASEFEATGVTLRGSFLFEVPHGYRMVVTPDDKAEAGIKCALVPLQTRPNGEVLPSWRWRYTMERGWQQRIRLQLVNTGHSGAAAPSGRGTGAPLPGQIPIPLKDLRPQPLRPRPAAGA